MKTRPLPSEVRFWKFVDLNSKSECWNWTGHLQKGRAWIKPSRTDRDQSRCASHVAWRIFNGNVPPGKSVLHRCDNMACVNPEHLFLGTQVENIRDRVAKGRSAKGQEVGNAKLTPDLILAIREDPLSQRLAAKKYGVGRTAVWQIRNRMTWKHVA